MLKMNKRGKDVNWSKLANASPKPKRLHLEEDDCDGLFHCPVQICNHDGFTTQRGCRKHVKNKHSWYYYFDEKPDSAQIDSLHVDQNNNYEANDQKITPRKSRAIASFDTTNKIAKTFSSWLTGSGGGCKSDRQAQQIVSKCLKFLKFCCEDEEELTFDIVDFSLCSPNLLFKFVDTMQDDWNLGHAGRGIGISVERTEFNRNLLEKGAQNCFQNDALAVDQRAGHRCLRSQGELGHTGRTVGSGGALLSTRAC